MKALSNDDIEAGFGPRRKNLSDNPGSSGGRHASIPSSSEIAAQVEYRRSKIRQYTQVGLKKSNGSVILVSSSQGPTPAAAGNTAADTADAQSQGGSGLAVAAAGAAASDVSSEYDPFSNIPNLSSNIDLSPRPSSDIRSSSRVVSSQVSNKTSQKSSAPPSISQSSAPPSGNPSSSSSSSDDLIHGGDDVTSDDQNLESSAAPSDFRSSFSVSSNRAYTSSCGARSESAQQSSEKVLPLSNSSNIKSVSIWPPEINPIETKLLQEPTTNQAVKKHREGLVKRALHLGNVFKKKRSIRSNTLSGSSESLKKSKPPVITKEREVLSLSKINSEENPSERPVPKAPSKINGEENLTRRPVPKAPSKIHKAPPSPNDQKPAGGLQPILVNPDLYKINQELIKDRVNLIEGFETKIKDLESDKVSTENIVLKEKLLGVSEETDSLRKQLEEAEKNVGELTEQNQSLHLQLLSAEKERSVCFRQIEDNGPLMNKYLERIAVNEELIEHLRNEKQNYTHTHDSVKCPDCSSLMAQAMQSRDRELSDLQSKLDKLLETATNEKIAHEADRAKLTAIITEQKHQIDRMAREISNFFSTNGQNYAPSRITKNARSCQTEPDSPAPPQTKPHSATLTPIDIPHAEETGVGVTSSSAEQTDVTPSPTERVASPTVAESPHLHKPSESHKQIPPSEKLKPKIKGCCHNDAPPKWVKQNRQTPPAPTPTQTNQVRHEVVTSVLLPCQNTPMPVTQPHGIRSQPILRPPENISAPDAPSRAEKSLQYADYTAGDAQQDLSWRVLQPGNRRMVKSDYEVVGVPVDHSLQWNPLWCNRKWHYGPRDQFINGAMQATDLWQYRWVDGRYRLESRCLDILPS